MASEEGAVAQNDSVESKPIDSSFSKSSQSIVADVLGKKGLSTPTSVNQAMKELSHKTDGLKVRLGRA